jgi:carbamoyl-phosphate synthase large subunit
VPYISKVTGVPIIDLATRVMLGEQLKALGYGTGLYPEIKQYAIKVPVFSTQKLPNVEVSLGPEMRSTGEVLGIGTTFEEALYKGFLGAGMPLPKEKGTLLVTIRPEDQKRFLPIAKVLDDLGYQFVATEGTAKTLEEANISVKRVKKISEGVPNILDFVRSGMVDMVINTPTKANDARRDGFVIRRAAIEASVPVMTSLDTVEGLVDILKAKLDVDQLNIYDITKL